MADTHLRIYTVESSWVHRNRPPATFPYPRVVALEADGQRVEGRFDLATEPRLSSYQVPEHVAATALGFFDRHVAGNDVDHPSSPERTGFPPDSLAVRYNSAMLALAMADVEFGDPAQAEALAAELAAGYEFQGRNIPAGVLGAVRRMATGQVMQHVVGLGANVSSCLTVVADNSNLAAIPYERLMYGYEIAGSPYELAVQPSA